MRFFTILGVTFYAGILILVGLGLIFLGMALFFNLLQPQGLNNLVSNLISNYLQSNRSAGIVISLGGLLLVLVSFYFAQIILGRFYHEKTIAFNTDSGRVTVALTLIEDLIKRLESTIPEIRELRPNVIVTKKGIVVELKIILQSEANIYDLTARLQELVRSKILGILPIEEQIYIRTHVVKISLSEDKEKKKKEAKEEQPTIPFSGYGRLI
ncbi:MAG: alkaline shock response membrane anchor protein AmaP [Candidatus Omnitrophica bacterium]|nr:alkaline shock response membrane anchor protein AmaP [Candidatus Omnitrophota bacterium]